MGEHMVEHLYTHIHLLTSPYPPPLHSPTVQHNARKQVSEAVRLKPADPQAALAAFKQAKEWESKLGELQVCICNTGCLTYQSIASDPIPPTMAHDARRTPP